MKKFFLLILVPAVFLAGCQKSLIDPESAANVPVVEAYLHCGDSLITVNLFKITPYSVDETSDTTQLSGLPVYLNGHLMNEASAGIYTMIPDNITIHESETYALSFDFYGKTISATTIIPAKPLNFNISATSVEVARIDSGDMPMGPGAFETIELTWDNTNNDYHFLAINYMEATEDYIDGNQIGNDFPKMRNSAPNQDNAFNLTSRDLQFFGTYRIILFTVNKEYAELYENVSSSSNNLTNPVSNINNGWGIFTGINSDTVYLEVKEE